MIEVAAGIIVSPDGNILLGRRPEGKPYPGYWEFPGGKIETGESASDALRRELKEEIGIDALHIHPWISRVFHYSHATVKLNFFKVKGWAGEPDGLENQELSWQNPHAVSVHPMLPANAPILRSLRLSDIYAITNAAELGADVQIAKLESALNDGLEFVQVREPEMDRSALKRFALEVVTMARESGAKAMINSEVELAHEIRAHGVHLTSKQLMHVSVKPDFDWCGASVHNARELDKAVSLGLDFAVLGHIQKTQSHPGTAGMGWEKFSDIAKGCPIPVYALGGLTRGDLPLAQQCGAQGIAMMRSAWE